MADDVFRDSEGNSEGLNESFEPFPKIRVNDGELPIEKLKAGTKEHTTVKEYFLDRLKYSERRMSGFYSRWNANERRQQAYIDLSKFEQELADGNDQSKPAAITSIVVPYSHATVSTIVTYLIHAFGGRNPIFNVGTYGSADPMQFLQQLYIFLQDSQVYGVGIMKSDWEVRIRERTVHKTQPKSGFLGIDLPPERVTTREKRVAYAGNTSSAIDPFRFFPDPRVPMTEVAKKGEWVIWREHMGLHELKALEAQGVFRHISDIPSMPSQRNENGGQNAPSDRGLRADGEGNPGAFDQDSATMSKNFIQIDQGTLDIIPAELGLGPSKLPEKWVFAVANRTQVIQAEPFQRDHDQHPVAVTEPYGNGYGFGQLGVVDLVSPMQDTMSWFMNSHIYNVRSVLNNNFIVDPSMVEMQDLNSDEPGKHIRLKRSAYGQDVRTAIQQLNITDVTTNNVKDMELFQRMADQIAAVNDNLRGIQSSGGRKTATEVRTSGEAGTSRLAALARLISAQALTNTAQQWTVNTQQYLDQELFMTVTGADGRRNPIHMSPEHITGDFYYPIHDGTLPTDRVAMLDIWREIFTGLLQVPELAMRYDLGGIFEFMAEMGGAGNLEKFRVDVAPDAMMAQQAQAGNVVPLNEAAGNIPGLSGNPTGTEANPRKRLQ